MNACWVIAVLVMNGFSGQPTVKVADDYCFKEQSQCVEVTKSKPGYFCVNVNYKPERLPDCDGDQKDQPCTERG